MFMQILKICHNYQKNDIDVVPDMLTVLLLLVCIIKFVVIKPACLTIGFYGGGWQFFLEINIVESKYSGLHLL